MKGVQCYELFGGIALKIHTFSFFHFSTAVAMVEQTSYGIASFFDRKPMSDFSCVVMIWESERLLELHCSLSAASGMSHLE